MPLPLSTYIFISVIPPQNGLVPGKEVDERAIRWKVKGDNELEPELPETNSTQRNQVLIKITTEGTENTERH